MNLSTNAGATHLPYHPGETSKSQEKLISSKYVSTVLRVMTTAANTIMPQFKTKASREDLSPEDREAREKGLQLVAHIEYLSRTSEEFRHWIQEGIDDIEAGRTAIFSEDGWKEE
jgi:hypothetical protein